MAEQKNVQEQDINQLIKVRRDKLKELQENGKDPFQITKYDVTNHSTDIKDDFDAFEGKEVSIAGRMMFKRVMGKASFCNVQDLKGSIQAYVARDEIGEDSYKDFKKYDIGDILGIKGKVFKTKTGEISIHASEVTLLSKSLQILPEKFHGLTDTDTRYRQRYVDLIMNQESKQTFIKRSQIIKEIRNFLAGRDFMEVETPMLVSNAGGAAMGKASFCNIQDLKGNIQVYVARDNIGEDSYADFKKSDIGDIYGVKGFAFRTKTGEISIHAEEITLLSKSLQILPEKFHGLTDTDTRYRQRYVDLIMNQESKEVFIKRSQILKEIRNFLAGRDFMEVETPMLVSNAGGAAARPFETHYNALNEDVKLRISLELYLKRLIVGGLERVYEIGRVFRNEGVDTRHNPEFTLMELYQAYTDYEGMMELTESMFRYLAEKVCGSTKISYNGVEIDLGKPFATNDNDRRNQEIRRRRLRPGT